MILASPHNMVVLKKIFACVCLFLDSENRSQKMYIYMREYKKYFFKVFERSIFIKITKTIFEWNDNMNI